MSAFTRLARLWLAVSATFQSETPVAGILPRRGRRRLERAFFEGLESRQMLTGTPANIWGSISTTNPGEGQSVTVLVSADGGDDTIGSWTITWGDGATSDISGASGSTDHAYDDNGCYSAYATPNGSCQYTNPSWEVTVDNVAPTASLSLSNTSIDEGHCVTVSLSDGTDAAADVQAGLHYSIAQSEQGLADNWGNACSSVQESFYYDDNGSYSLYARIFDKDGAYTQYSVNALTVNNVAPTGCLSITGYSSCNEGDTVSVGFWGESDPSCADTAAGFHYSFAFDPGSLAANYAGASSNSSANVPFDDSGERSLIGRIFDKDDGYTQYTIGCFSVINVAPTASFIAGGTVNEGEAISMFTGASDPSSADTQAGFHYSVALDSGGLAGSYYSASPSPLFTFPDNGSYQVYGRIFDKDDGYTDYCATVCVTNVAPSAMLTIYRTAHMVSFHDEQDSSSDMSAGFRYSFGVDGACPTGCYALASTSSQFTFPETGYHTITCRIIDKDEGYTDYCTDTNFVPSAPSAPSGSAVSGQQVTLTWTDTSHFADGFIIEQAEGNGDFVPVATAPASASSTDSYTLTGLFHPSTTYRFRICASSGSALSAPTDTPTLTTPAVPDYVTNMTATATSPTAITLSWDNQPSVGDVYTIQRSSDNGVSWTTLPLAPLIPPAPSSTTFTYTDTGLSSASRYLYRVFDTNAAGPSGVVAGQRSTVPDTPDVPSVTEAHYHRIDLDWPDVAGSNVTGYRVYRSTTSGFTPGPDNLIGTTNVSSYSDSSVTGQQTYYYKTTALNGDGDSSSASGETSATAPAPKIYRSASYGFEGSGDSPMDWWSSPDGTPARTKYVPSEYPQLSPDAGTGSYYLSSSNGTGGELDLKFGGDDGIVPVGTYLIEFIVYVTELGLSQKFPDQNDNLTYTITVSSDDEAHQTGKARGLPRQIDGHRLVYDDFEPQHPNEGEKNSASISDIQFNVGLYFTQSDENNAISIDFAVNGAISFPFDGTTDANFDYTPALGVDNVMVRQTSAPETCGCAQVDNNSGSSGASASGMATDDLIADVSTDTEIGSGMGAAGAGGTDENGVAQSSTGNNAMNDSMSYVVQVDNSTVAVVKGVNNITWYDANATGIFKARYGGQSTLTHSGGQYVEMESGGSKTYYNDFTGATAALQGKITEKVDAAGNEIDWQYDSTTNLLDRVTQVQTATDGSTVRSSLVYAFTTTSNGPRLTSITGYRKSWTGTEADSTANGTEVRYTDYTYDAAGNAQTVATTDAGITDTTYFRYYNSDYSVNSPGYNGAIKLILKPESYRQAVAAGVNPLTASDAALLPYADTYYEYDATRRVTKRLAKGEGCSGCGNGQGEHGYSYERRPGAQVGYNSWNTKTTETLPDGSGEIIYYNAYGQSMLDLTVANIKGTSPVFSGTFTLYDDSGNATKVVHASALDLSSITTLAGLHTTIDQYPDLLDFDTSGHSAFIADNSGLIDVYYYSSTTSASANARGTVAGYLHSTAIRHGELGSDVPQSDIEYFSLTDADGNTTYPVASETRYRGDNSEGAETTYYNGSYAANTSQLISETVLSPAVSTTQNGNGNQASQTTWYDDSGRVIWARDAEGYLTHTVYDATTGAILQQIVDAAQPVPAAGVTRGSGLATALNLTTTYTIDTQGRTTKVTDPIGNVTFTVYDDADYEVRTYSGYMSGGSFVEVGPTSVHREDQVGNYVEDLTLSATPSLTGGVPNGMEPITNIQSLSRSYNNAAGQLDHTDVYFNFSGYTYSATNAGTQNVNFYRTQYAYGPMGRLIRVLSPTGTITRTVYDGFGRTASTWIGTNDTPTSGDWSPTNTAGTNLVKVSENQYDNSGNLTRTITFPSGNTDERATLYYYDWRGRLVATKSGVTYTDSGYSTAATEYITDNTHPISYTIYDNLNEAIETRAYDGDGVTITTTNGVPDAPADSLLRAESRTKYDDLGRAFDNQVFSVGLDGTVSTNSLDSFTWFSQNGNVIKTLQPGGLVQKYAYDGAGRLTASYTTDGGGDAPTGDGNTYDDANSLTGDIVLEQTEAKYDGDGNVVFQISRQRFHDDPVTDTSYGVHDATGALGDINGLLPDGSTTAPKARAYYSEFFYDAGGRTIASVNLGTNGGVSLTSRPDSTVPARSDTKLVTSYTYNSAGLTDTVTDPKGVASKTRFDALGRTTKTIENYVDAGNDNDDTNDVLTASQNRTTEYTYDGAGHTLTMTAINPGHPDQTTAYFYGVTPNDSLPSGLFNNDLLAKIEYPDASTGNPSSTDRQLFSYNAIGEQTAKQDQLDTVHEYDYDLLGHMTDDIVTILGTGVDGSIRRLSYTFNTQGLPELFTSCSDTDGTVIVNQVKDEYNGLGQLTAERQSDTGAIGTFSPVVRYTYSEMASGANHSRLTAVIYPDGRQTIYRYGEVAGDLDDRISRVSALAEPNVERGGIHELEHYSYLGLSTPVLRTRPAGNSQLSYISTTVGDAGDQYSGLDRFGRIVDQNWSTLDYTPVTMDRFVYGYDCNGNPLYKENAISSANSELYSYDSLDRLTNFARGTLNAGKMAISGTATRSQTWSLDALGNWNSVTTDGVTQTRTSDARNQIDSMTGTTTQPDYNANGNMTVDPTTGNTTVYDAWNHMVEVSDGKNTLGTYAYDALGRRIDEQAGVNPPVQHVYSAQWQVLEDRSYGVTHYQYVWSPFYVDDLILRDEYAANSWSQGALNLNYGEGGLSRTNLGGDYNWPNAMATAPNGITYLACDTNYGPSIEAINADGTVATGFGSNGIKTLAIGNLQYLPAITIDSSGRILVAGSIETGNMSRYVLIRLLPSGDLDTSFNATGTPGYVRTGEIGPYVWPAQVLVDPITGGAFIIGNASSNGIGSLALARFTSTGEADTTFGNGGLVSLEPMQGAEVMSVGSAALDSAGRIVICACAYGSTVGVGTLVVRINLDGSYDTTFGPSGQAYVFINSMWSSRMALQADGKIVLASNDLKAARLLSDGSPDPSFNSGNVLSCFTDVPGYDINDLAIDAYGSIIVTGVAGTDYPGEAFFVGRISPDGVAGTYEVTEFPYVVPNDPMDHSDAEPYFAEIRPDGTILVAGPAVGFVGENSWWGLGLACYNAYDGLSQRLYVQHDANFNVTGLADATGTVVQRFQEDPYGGNPLVLTGNWQPTTDNYSWLYLHQSGRWDGVSGTYYFRERDGNPDGFWTTPDPTGYPDGSNQYLSVRANPLGAVDPMGLAAPTSQPTTQPSTTITYTDAGMLEFDNVEDLRKAAQDERHPGIAYTQPKVNGVTLKRVGCRVIISNVAWSTRLLMLTEKAYAQQHPNASRDDYGRQRDALLRLSNAQWYYGAGFGAYGATIAHEQTHAKQFRRAAAVAIPEYITKFTKRNNNWGTEQLAEWALGVEQKRIEITKLEIETLIFKTWREQNPPGNGFQADAYGEEEAVIAARKWLEDNYTNNATTRPIR